MGVWPSPTRYDSLKVTGALSTSGSLTVVGALSIAGSLRAVGPLSAVGSPNTVGPLGIAGSLQGFAAALRPARSKRLVRSAPTDSLVFYGALTVPRPLHWLVPSKEWVALFYWFGLTPGPLLSHGPLRNLGSLLFYGTLLLRDSFATLGCCRALWLAGLSWPSPAR
jgi:hypothetical protein